MDKQKIYLSTSNGQLLLVPEEHKDKARFTLDLPESDVVFIQNAYKQYEMLQKFLAEAVEDEIMHSSKPKILIP